jgi:hypothetical protein
MSPSFSAQKQLQRVNQHIQKIFTIEKIVEYKPRNKHRSKSWKVSTIVTPCKIITRNKLIKPAITGTKSKIRLKKRKTSRPKLARGGKSPKIAPKRILATNLRRVKVNPFPTVNLKTNSFEKSNPPGFNMGKKREKTPSSKDTDSSDVENRTQKEVALSKLRAKYGDKKTGKRPRESESEEADESGDENEIENATSEDSKMPPQKKGAKTRNPKRRKKLSAPARIKLRKIKEEAASDQEAKKLSSPARKHKSSRSGKAISKLHIQKQNARSCRNYELKESDKGPRMVHLEDLPFKAKDKPAKGKNKKRRKSDMLKVIRAQDREYGGKHLRPYFNGSFYQPRIAAANRQPARNDTTGT